MGRGLVITSRHPRSSPQIAKPPTICYCDKPPMSRLGSSGTPLRVAVIGSGPAGFYTVQHLFQTAGLAVEVDMYDRLPTPFGLVRMGVAPDHQKIKAVVGVYNKLAADPRFRFFGSVEYGTDLSIDDVQAHYHQIVFTTGAQSDRRLNIPGEDLEGSYPATKFVAWYNGHPDYASFKFDLNHPAAVVIGVGNVAIDVARMLCRTSEELSPTDIADHALEALRLSGVKHVHLLGRRGAAQAAFSNPEISEVGKLADAAARTLPEELVLDEDSRAEAAADRTIAKKIEILQSYASREPSQKSRQLTIRFLVSPVEILGDESGRVRAVKIVKNELYRDEKGALRPKANGQFETIECGLVLRSVGYKGVPLAGLPFLDDRGVVPNDNGRVVDPEGLQDTAGVYVSGWIKRGPTGLIGTNNADAKETVASMLADLERGRAGKPRDPGREDIDRLLKNRGVRYVSYEEWQDIDRLETARGMPEGRPRVKFTKREEIFEALDILEPPD
jgi:ferredoxin--NADP+ reductase